MKNTILMIVQWCLCGLSIGWLLGLSITPLLQGILTSIMTVVIGLLTIISGISMPANNDPNNSIDFLSRLKTVNFSGLTSFVMFLAIGSSLGLYTRSNELLGLDPEKFATKWKSKSYNEDLIKRRMFDKIYSKDSLNELKQKQLGNILYGISASECSELAKANTYKQLLNELKTLEQVDSRIKSFLETRNDSASVFALRKILCP